MAYRPERYRADLKQFRHFRLHRAISCRPAQFIHCAIVGGADHEGNPRIVAVNDENNGYDIAEIERWIFHFFTVGMPEIGGFPWLPGTKPPDRNHLFWSMVDRFGNDVRPVMMYHAIWTIH